MALKRAAEADDGAAILSLVAANRPACRAAFTDAAIVAASNRNLVALEALLDALPECDPNSCDVDGVSILAAACTRPDDPAAAAVLLDRGCDPLLADKDGSTPLHEAATSFCVRVVALLMDDVRVALSALPYRRTQYKPSPVVALAEYTGDSQAVALQFKAATDAAARFRARVGFILLCTSIGGRFRRVDAPWCTYDADNPRANRLATFMFKLRLSRSAGAQVVSLVGHKVGLFL